MVTYVSRGPDLVEVHGTLLQVVLRGDRTPRADANIRVATDS